MDTENTRRLRALINALNMMQVRTELPSRSSSYYQTLIECSGIVQDALDDSIEMDREKSEMRADILPFRRSEYDV